MRLHSLKLQSHLRMGPWSSFQLLCSFKRVIYIKKGTISWTIMALLGIVIIVGIVLIYYRDYASRETPSRSTQHCRSNLRTIDGAINSYHAEYGYYPTGSVEAAFVPNWIHRNPTCPSAVAAPLGTYTLIGDGTSKQTHVSCPGINNPACRDHKI